MDEIIPSGISGMTVKHFLPLATKIGYGFIVFWLLMYLFSFLLNLFYRVKEIFEKQKENIAVQQTSVEVDEEVILVGEMPIVQEEVPLEITEVQAEDVPISAPSIIELPNPAILENYIKKNRRRFSKGEDMAMLYDILQEKDVTYANLKDFHTWLQGLTYGVQYGAISDARTKLMDKLSDEDEKTIKKRQAMLNQITEFLI